MINKIIVMKTYFGEIDVYDIGEGRMKLIKHQYTSNCHIVGDIYNVLHKSRGMLVADRFINNESIEINDNSTINDILNCFD
jgi:hypothetical protein